MADQKKECGEAFKTPGGPWKVVGGRKAGRKGEKADASRSASEPDGGAVREALEAWRAVPSTSGSGRRSSVAELPRNAPERTSARKRRRLKEGSPEGESSESAASSRSDLRRMSRDEVRGALDPLGVSGALDPGPLGVAEHLKTQLAALGSMRVLPTYREGEGRPFSGLCDLTVRGFREVCLAADELEGMAAAGEGRRDRELGDLRDRVATLERTVTALREENEALRRCLESPPKAGAGAKPPAIKAGGVPATRIPPQKGEVAPTGAAARGNSSAVADAKPSRGQRKRARAKRVAERARYARAERDGVLHLLPPRPSGSDFPPLPAPNSGGGRKKAGKKSGGGAPTAAGVPVPSAAKPAAGVGARLPAVPRSAAVTLTSAGGRSYADLLKEARERVDLKEVGVPSLRVRRALNGGYVFEIPGPDGPEKADRLARELEDALIGSAVIARPAKTAELRLVGLDDSVGVDEVEGALRAIGKCPKDALRLGSIRRAAGGLGAMWVKCPLPLARQLAQVGHLFIGWSRVRVVPLGVRPLQCYRCLGFGHAAAACKSGVVRQGRCFRCGGAGHVAAGCDAAMRCTACDVLGMDPGHRMGGPACKAAHPPTKRQRRRAARGAGKGVPGGGVAAAERPRTGTSVARAALPPVGAGAPAPPGDRRGQAVPELARAGVVRPPPVQGKPPQVRGGETVVVGKPAGDDGEVEPPLTQASPASMEVESEEEAGCGSPDLTAPSLAELSESEWGGWTPPRD